MHSHKKEIGKYLKHATYNQFQYAINISIKHKYIYIETPKVGCSTIKDTLQRMELDYPELTRVDFEDIHTRNCSPLLTPSQACNFDRLLNNHDFFVFCFVRNPYTRLLSAYLDKLVNNNGSQKKGLLFARGCYPIETSKEISFEEFIETICSQSIIQMNPHWRIQYYQTYQDNINYDFIGKMENFRDDCDYAFSRIRKDYKEYFRSEQRHATKSTELLNQYFNDSLKEKVFDKYRIDFEYFGYDKDWR